MLVQLPLPYIRPFGSKCFAGGLLHFRGSGFKAGDLLEPESPPASAAPSMEVYPAPDAILCSKHPKGKNSRPATAGPSLTTDPLSLTQKRLNGQYEVGLGYLTSQPREQGRETESMLNYRSIRD